MEAFNLSAFDPQNPQAFYLQAELAAHADDCFDFGEGIKLPVHRHILMSQSETFMDAYNARNLAAGTSTSAAASTSMQQQPKQASRKRSRQQAEPAQEGWNPFEGLALEFSVKDLAILLRLLYRPYEARQQNLVQLSMPELCSLARLAAFCRVPWLLAPSVLEPALRIKVRTAQEGCSLGELYAALELAEELQLKRLRRDVEDRLCSVQASRGSSYAELIEVMQAAGQRQLDKLRSTALHVIASKLVNCATENGDNPTAISNDCLALTALSSSELGRVIYMILTALSLAPQQARRSVASKLQAD